MSTITTAQISELMRTGLRAVNGKYATKPKQFTEIYSVHRSDKNIEREPMMRYTSIGQVIPQGSPVATDTMGQRTLTTYQHQYVGLSITMTRQSIMDNLYKTEFPQYADSLANSLKQAKEVFGASVLDLGFNANYPLADGQPLFSLNHPFDFGTFANTTNVPMDFTEAALEEALIKISQFKDWAGLLINAQAKKVIMPSAGQFTAERLLGSSFRTNTNTNDISAIYNLQSIPEGYRVNNYLSNPKAWFVLTDIPSGLKHYVREEPEIFVYTDYSTSNVQAKMMERYSFGVSDPRAIFGGQGIT